MAVARSFGGFKGCSSMAVFSKEKGSEQTDRRRMTDWNAVLASKRRTIDGLTLRVGHRVGWLHHAEEALIRLPLAPGNFGAENSNVMFSPTRTRRLFIDPAEHPPCHRASPGNSSRHAWPPWPFNA